MNVRAGIAYGIACGLVAALLVMLVGAMSTRIDEPVRLLVVLAAPFAWVLVTTGEAAELAARREGRERL